MHYLFQTSDFINYYIKLLGKVPELKRLHLSFRKLFKYTFVSQIQMECVNSYLESLHQWDIKMSIKATYFGTIFLYSLDSEMVRRMASRGEGRVV